MRLNLNNNILYIQVNMWNIIYLNCGERYEDMIDHRSYTHNLSSCEIKACKEFRPEWDSKPRTGEHPYLPVYVSFQTNNFSHECEAYDV